MNVVESHIAFRSLLTRSNEFGQPWELSAAAIPCIRSLYDAARHLPGCPKAARVIIHLRDCVGMDVREIEVLAGQVYNWLLKNNVPFDYLRLTERDINYPAHIGLVHICDRRQQVDHV